MITVFPDHRFSAPGTKTIFAGDTWQMRDTGITTEADTKSRLVFLLLLIGFRRLIRELPDMPRPADSTSFHLLVTNQDLVTFFTAIPIFFGMKITPRDENGLPLNESLRQRHAGFFVNPRQGGPRNRHLMGSLHLGHPLVIQQPDRFILLE